MADEYPLSHVLYYDGEFLKVAEFQDEQDYHIDRRQRHDRLLHVAGVCDGLVVTKVDATTITVSAGTAIDGKGQTILLSESQSLTIPSGASELHVQIQFNEDETDMADENSPVQLYTRLTQAPVLLVQASIATDAVVLGQVTVSNGQVNVTDTGRVYSGLKLPGLGDGGYLRAQGSVAELGCSLSVKGALSVAYSEVQAINLWGTGHGVGVQSSTTYFRSDDHFAFYKGGVHSGSVLDPGLHGAALLTIRGTGRVGIGTTDPASTLHVVGDIVLGLAEANKKFILHSRTHANGDYLMITNDNAAGDDWEWGHGIVLDRAGKVGIGTVPEKTLHVNGDALVTGSLTVGAGAAAIDVAAAIANLKAAMVPRLDGFRPESVDHAGDHQVTVSGFRLEHVANVRLRITSVNGEPVSPPADFDCAIGTASLRSLNFEFPDLPSTLTGNDPWTLKARILLDYGDPAGPVESPTQLTISTGEPPGIPKLNTFSPDSLDFATASSVTVAGANLNLVTWVKLVVDKSMLKKKDKYGILSTNPAAFEVACTISSNSAASLTFTFLAISDAYGWYAQARIVLGDDNGNESSSATLLAIHKNWYH